MHRAILSISIAILLGATGNGQDYPAPNEGWDYKFDGNSAASSGEAALDGTWDHNNNSDQWDGTSPGTGNPGGVAVVQIEGEAENNALLMVDAITVSGKNNNRRFALTHNLAEHEGVPSTFLKTGSTIAFRIRLPSSSVDLFNTPNGLSPHANAKGIVNLRGEGGRISFSLGVAGTDSGYPSDGLFVSDSNSTFFHALDPSSWNEFWVTTIQSEKDADRYDLRVYINGSILPFIVKTIGLSSGIEESYPYLSLQLSSTPDTAAVELDYIAFKAGVHVPNDADLDGIPDTWELTYFPDISLNKTADPDGDGLTNEQEFNLNTDPTVTDTDGDGLNDEIEYSKHSTDPTKPDTDGDGISDREELTGQPPTDPLLSDTDRDGLSDAEEIQKYNTDPNSEDTDKDGANDLYEIEKGYDPNNPDETPIFPAFDHLLINEFMATEGSSLTDSDRERPDWIEIWNPTRSSVNLDGHYLTDDKETPNKWAFAGQALLPNQFLVVFASGKNRTDPKYEQHTNFRLSSGGEYLALTRKDGEGNFIIISEYASEFPSQEEGISYGLNPEDLTEGYLQSTTPRSENGKTALGFVKDTQFDVDRGFFTEQFILNITTATPDAIIRYTTDGSPPTASMGNLYRDPISINRTTTVRAAAFKTDHFPTNIDTHTYFFLDDVQRQHGNPPGWPLTENGQNLNYGMDSDITSRYGSLAMIEALSAIPSISIVTKQSNLTSSGVGIYVNPGQHGKNWERPSSFEIIDPKQLKPNVQINCGLRIRGGFSRTTSNPKHAFRLFFRDEYDGELKYPLFEAEGADVFSKLDLRTSQNYSWAFQGSGTNTFLREVLGRDLQGATGQPYTKSRYYHLYLNGVYWGLFMSDERPEANFGETYLGGNEADYDTIKSAGSSGGYDTEATDGSISNGSAWHTLWNMAKSQKNNPSLTRFMEMQGKNPDGTRNPEYPVYLDVNNLIDYSMIIGYTGNADAPPGNNNWFGIRNRAKNDLGFQFFVHDGEHSLGSYGTTGDMINRDRNGGGRGNYNKSNPAHIRFDIEESSPEFRLRFADRAHEYLFNEGILTTPKVLEMLNARKKTVSDVIIAESARWGDSARGDPLDKQDWENAVRSLENEISRRREIFLGHLRAAKLYPEITAPVYMQHGGQVVPGSTINIIAPLSATHLYYIIGTEDPNTEDWQDDLDPRLLGGTPSPKAKSLLINETVLVAENATKRAIMPTGSEADSVWFMPDFDASSWPEGTLGAGYDRTTRYRPFFDPSFDFGEQVSSSAMETIFMRITFHVEDPSEHNSMTLKVRYDDGFVAYLNGTEIARAQAPGRVGTPLAFDSASTAAHRDNLAEGFQPFSVSDHSTLLRKGTNVLAIQGLNDLRGSSDMLLSASLVSNKTLNGNTVYVTIPEPITSPVWIKSRSYDSKTGQWSALNSAPFTTATRATSQNIVISEVHYHPSPPTEAESAIDPSFGQDDFEFVEIMNISKSAVDLGNSAFTLTPSGDHLEGIEFTFSPTTIIGPEERLVVVANSSAFAARYPGTSITGDYSNRLSNTGEWITLVDASGSVIDSFRYNDVNPWPEQADGEGPSIHLKDPATLPDPSDPASWAAGLTNGGSPTKPSNKDFVGDPLADVDGDGGTAIIEYALGLSDLIPSSENFPRISIINVEEHEYLGFSFRLNPEATEITHFIETSEDLISWTNSEKDDFLKHVKTVNDPDGVPVHTFRLKTPISDEGSARYFRLGVHH